MQFESLTWPNGHKRHDSTTRKTARFHKNNKPVTIAEAKQRLLKEIESWTRSGKNWRINPESVIISSNWVLTRSGIPSIGQKEPSDPGVVVYFNLDGDDYCLPCDQWDRAADNLAAIAAHLGAMRDQERWGVGSTRQSFLGYAALPPQKKWWEVLGVSPQSGLHEIKEAYRTLAKAHHPDVGGSRQKWDEIHQAWLVAQNHQNMNEKPV